jgi:hypothetical protein
MIRRLPGLIVTILGFAFLHQSWNLNWGTFAKLGSGFWPSVLALSLIVIGIVLILSRTVDTRYLPLKLWPTLILIATIIIYAGIVTGAGLILTALCNLLTALLARFDSVDGTVVATAGLVLYSVLIFLLLLGIDIPLWPPSLCC